MMSLEDLLWLYKLSLQMELKAEKEWLKAEIQERLNPQTAPMEKEIAESYQVLKKSFEWLYEVA